MSESNKKVIRIELTDAQTKLIREETGKDAKAIELSVEDLEERISPMSRKGPYAR